MVQANRAQRQAGSVVGLHYHLHQADYWTVPVGQARIVLHDLRQGSPTDGATLLMDLTAENALGVERARAVRARPVEPPAGRYRAGLETPRRPAAMKVTALAGGVGAARMLNGLVSVLPPASVTAIVNTADDMVLHGLYISPDID